MKSAWLTGTLLVLAAIGPDLALAQPPARPSPGANQMFHFALVIADNEGTPSAAQNLPPGMQKALADIQGFLPFRNYRVFDSALTRATGHARVMLHGPSGEDYVASLQYREEPAGGKRSFLVDTFRLMKRYDPEEDRTLDPNTAPLPPEEPLLASFRIEAGETVVVGSSRLKGDRALVILLTAVP
jgi:hypothetical protein